MLKVSILRSIDDLRAHAVAWDDLWQHSDDTLASSCSEPLALWLERFAAGRPFRAIVVENGSRMLAALPLVERPWAGPFHAAALPTNEWPGGGALLWDKQCEEAVVGQLLIDGIRRLPWSLLLLDGALPERVSWQRFIQAMRNGRVGCDLRTRWHAAQVPIDHDWPAALAQLSRKHRQRMNAAQRKLDDLGGMSFQRFAFANNSDLEPQLRDAFTIEDHSWKGAAGTAVLRVPGIFPYLVQICRTLAVGGNVHLALLRVGETAIAFCLGIVSKGVWHSCKIGYDAAFAEVLPGHLLHYCLQEELHGDATCRAIDYMGPATEYHRHWRPGTYPVARLAVAPRGMLGKLALWGYGRMKIESTNAFDDSPPLPEPDFPAIDPIPIGSVAWASSP